MNGPRGSSGRHRRRTCRRMSVLCNVILYVQGIPDRSFLSTVISFPGAVVKYRPPWCMPMNNPRYSNGALRRKMRARFKAMNAPCGICGGRLGEIRYDEPSDSKHPLSFVIDEILPVSKWKQFGYDSPAAAAQDYGNVQAAHYCCNAAKGAKINYAGTPIRKENAKGFSILPVPQDGDW